MFVILLSDNIFLRLKIIKIMIDFDFPLITTKSILMITQDISDNIFDEGEIYEYS